MLPILAAVSAISTADKIASGVLSRLTHSASADQTGGKSDTKAGAGSFAAALLTAQGAGN